jgi:hypothetical protein
MEGSIETELTEGVDLVRPLRQPRQLAARVEVRDLASHGRGHSIESPLQESQHQIA